MSQVILYDLPSKGSCACWSLNPWKTRLVLNYKGIDYKTEWLEYPDIAPKFKSLKVPPNAKGTEYTIPLIQLPDGSPVMDSLPIAQALERTYPSPSLYLDYEKLQQVISLTTSLAETSTPTWKAKVPRVLLSERSAEYFRRTRHQRYNMSLEQQEAEYGNEERWEESKPAAEELGGILRGSGGPYYMGDTVSYADFITVGFFHCLKRIDESLFEKAVGLDPTFRPLYDACGKWLERDDH